MHLLLTDRLTCPRCGPAFGLILRADELVERRIGGGVLGCPNCRESYPIEKGVGDLRPRPRSELPTAPFADGAGASDDDLDRVQALLGLGGEIGLSPGVAQTAFVGPAARYAAGMSGRLPDLEMVTLHPDARPASVPDEVSAVISSGTIPLLEQTVRGVVLEGPEASGWIASAARVVAPRNRVAVLDPPEETAERMRAAGLQLRLEAAEAVVGERNPGAPTRSPGVAPLSGAR